MNSKLNRSLSQIFQAPLLPNFGKASDSEKKVPSRVRASMDEKKMMDERLASRLSSKTRSSRKTRISQRKSATAPMEASDSIDASDGTMSTTPNSNHSSLSSLESNSVQKEDIETAHRMNQIMIQKDAFDDIQQKLQDKAKSTSHSAATTSVEETRASKPPPFRRVQSEGAGLRRMTDKIETKVTTPKARKSLMGAKSLNCSSKSTTGAGRSSRKSVERSDPSKRPEAKGGSALTPLRRTTSNKSGTRRCAGRRSGSNSTLASKTTVPTVAVEATWTCKCGYVLGDRYSFCGMCGSKKHWTCEDCQFVENLSVFVYCGNCGVERDESSGGSCGSDPFLDPPKKRGARKDMNLSDPFFSPRVTPPKLVTMFE